MLNNRVLAVFKREVKERVVSKGFIFMTILLPVFMFALLGIQVLLLGSDSGTKFNIDIITESQELTNKLQDELTNSEFVKEGNYTFDYFTMNKDELKEFLNEKKQELIDEKITGIVFIPEESLINKKVEYYSKTPKNIKLSERLSRPINKVLLDTYFDNRALSQEELDFARQIVDFSSFKVSKDTGYEEEGYGSLVLSYLFTFLLYMSLLFMGQIIMQSVIEEKTSRIVEVILSSVSPKELMTGKVLGSAITGVLQMVIWLTPVMFVISTTYFALPPEITFSITMGQIVYLLINFFFGLLIFLGLFAVVGSIFDNPQDAQSGLWPVMVLIIIPFFIAISLIENPNSGYADIASMAPLSNIIVMPAKMTMVDVPVWKLVSTVLVNIATLFVIFPIAGKIYRVGILITGKKPKWSEVIRWLKYKY